MNNGYLADQNGNSSSKRLFGFIALLILGGALGINLWTGHAPDPTIILVLGTVVVSAIGGATAEFFAAVHTSQSEAVKNP